MPSFYVTWPRTNYVGVVVEAESGDEILNEIAAGNWKFEQSLKYHATEDGDFGIVDNMRFVAAPPDSEAPKIKLKHFKTKGILDGI